MEFFEKEYGVKFVDHKTGKTRQELIAEQELGRNCGNCLWGAKGGEYNYPDDIVCVNADSDNVSEFVTDEMKCYLWEQLPKSNGDEDKTGV